MVPHKPHGLANRERHPTPINTVIEDFVYEDEGSVSQEESEDGEDELEYPNSEVTSLVSPSFLPIPPRDFNTQIQVSIKQEGGTPSSSQGTKNQRPGVNSLPLNIRQLFADVFIPTALQEVGRSSTPWQNISVDVLQECVNVVYTGLDYVVERGDALESSVG